MTIRTRLRWLERRFRRFKKYPPIIFVHAISGETVESKYQEYLNKGGDPRYSIYDIQWFIYTPPTKEMVTNPAYMGPFWNEEEDSCDSYASKQVGSRASGEPPDGSGTDSR